MCGREAGDLVQQMSLDLSPLNGLFWKGRLGLTARPLMCHGGLLGWSDRGSEWAVLVPRVQLFVLGVESTHRDISIYLILPFYDVLL